MGKIGAVDGQGGSIIKKLIFAVTIVLALGLVFAVTPSPAQAEIGIVIMHGKGGENLGKSPTRILALFLQEKGFIVSAPDMPWQADRIFDKTVEETMAEIDGIVAELKSEGAERIVVAGHSFGANVAIAYGARREGLAGVIAMALGHIPEIWSNRFAKDVAKARTMVEAGNGDNRADFNDVNQGKKTTFNMKAKYYLSWYDPDGQAVMPKNAAILKPGTPLMWIIGELDGMAERGEGYAYAKVPTHSNSKYEVIGGGHGATPKKGKGEILKWLKDL